MRFRSVAEREDFMVAIRSMISLEILRAFDFSREKSEWKNNYGHFQNGGKAGGSLTNI